MRIKRCLLHQCPSVASKCLQHELKNLDVEGFPLHFVLPYLQDAFFL